jgi:hypothetical protein
MGPRRPMLKSKVHDAGGLKSLTAEPEEVVQRPKRTRIAHSADHRSLSIQAASASVSLADTSASQKKLHVATIDIRPKTKISLDIHDDSLSKRNSTNCKDNPAK